MKGKLLPKTFVKHFLQLILVAFSFINCANPYALFSDQSSNAAIYHEALKAYNNQNYNLALQYFQQLSPDFLNLREVKFYYAQTLAGKCGYNFLDFLDALTNATIGTPTLFASILSLWGNKSIAPAFCTQAETQIKQIWANFTPSNEEKLFMVLLSFSKMGMYMRYKHDVAENNGLGDGNVDAGVDSCTPGSPPGQFTDSEINEIITGFALMFNNLSSLASVWPGTASLQATLNTLCTTPGVTFCNLTNANNITNADRKSMRNLLVWNGTGLDGLSCTPFVTCCP